MARNKRFIATILILLVVSSCEEALETSLTNNKVVLLAPANNLVTTSTLQSFHWNEMQGANTYELQIVSPGFDSIAKFIVDTTVAGFMYNTTLDQGVYQWRVRAKNNSTTS